MKPIAPICAAGLREALAYLERARSRCQDVATAKFLELVVARIEKKISETDQSNLPQLDRRQESTQPSSGGAR